MSTPVHRERSGDIVPSCVSPGALILVLGGLWFACGRETPVDVSSYDTAASSSAQDSGAVGHDSGAGPADDAGVPDAGPPPDAGEQPYDAGPPVDPSCGGLCPCPDAGLACGVVPLVDGTQLCASPRADPEAEWLAMESRGTFVAEQDVYERVHKDLAGIRATWPGLNNVRVMPSFASGLVLQTTQAAALTDGGTPLFDCLLRTYRGRVTRVWQVIPGMAVEFEGIIDVRQLVPAFKTLRGVVSASPNGICCDGPDICAVFDGGSATYIFDDASGDCPSGCYIHHYSGFVVAADGTVAALGTWSRGEDAGPPAWFSVLPECTKNL